MDYIEIAKKYATNHSHENSKEDALWVIALSLLSIAEREAAQHQLAADLCKRGLHEGLRGQPCYHCGSIIP